MNWETCKLFVMAHRGDTRSHVENTLEAVESALKMGCDGVEADLQLTADGEVVLFHDETLERLGGSPEKIRELSLPRLRETRLKGSRIPTLQELFDLVRDKALLNLEIKTILPFSATLEKKLLSLLNLFRLGPTILVSSFHPLPLWRLKRWAPEIRRGYLFQNRYFRTKFRRTFESVIDPFSWNPSLHSTSSRLIQRGHEKKRRIFVWNINDEEGMKYWTNEGIDGLFTDRPDIILHALGRTK